MLEIPIKNTNLKKQGLLSCFWVSLFGDYEKKQEIQINKWHI